VDASWEAQLLDALAGEKVTLRVQAVPLVLVFYLRKI